MADDFMPLLGWDYVEFWVGNAKQAAYYYENAMGFTRTAYAGPETGVRDRASYVLEQADVRFVVTSALREEHEITKHHARHGVGLMNIDHVVGNVELGRMNDWVEFYERVFGMTNIIHFGDDQIQTEYSALMSK